MPIGETQLRNVVFSVIVEASMSAILPAVDLLSSCCTAFHNSHISDDLIPHVAKTAKQVALSSRSLPPDPSAAFHGREKCQLVPASDEFRTFNCPDQFSALDDRAINH
jgi:hypothetical protein